MQTKNINNIKNNSSGKSDELMTLSQVASYLKYTENTIMGLIEKNDIPFLKIEDQYKFLKPVIDDWLLAKRTAQKVNYTDIKNMSTLKDMANITITTFIDREYIIQDIKKGSKEEILRQLIKPLAEKKIVVSENFHLMKLSEREKIVSTGIGHGLALPHLKNIKENPKNAPCVVFGICREGADFEALDEKPVYLFFMLCTQNQAIHLKIMALISKLFVDENLKNSVINAPDKETIIKILESK